MRVNWREMHVSSVTLRVSEQTRDVLRELARREGTTMGELLERAVEQYRQERLIAASNAAYAALRRDSKAAADFDAEVAEWDPTLSDGLDRLG
jgi:hypothetical protein